MKKVITLILTAVFIGLFGCASSSASDPKVVQKNAQEYIQKNFSDFSKGSFGSGTTVSNESNNVYKVAGKMQDDGGWEHEVSEEIQVSPNGSKFIVCSLWIDGKNYVSNSPKEMPSSTDEGASESLTVSLYPQDQTNNTVITKVIHYDIGFTNSGEIPINGLKFKIECSSPNVILSSTNESNPVKKINNTEYEWSLKDKIDPKYSSMGSLGLTATSAGEYSVDIVSYGAEDNKPFCDSKGDPVKNNITFSVFDSTEDAQKADGEITSNSPISSYPDGYWDGAGAQAN